MRYLGIDYGKKRIGLSFSDERGKIAFPKGMLFNKGDKKTIAKLKSSVQKGDVSKIIIGLPIGLSGKETDQTREVRRFAGVLKKEINIPVEFENEMLTTRLVEREGIRRVESDSAAAAVILQSYLDKTS